MAGSGLPGRIQPMYDRLSNELVWIHAKWQVYRQIFGTSQEDVDLLNRTAPFFFRVLQQTLFEDILISIYRLAGPSRSVGKDNLNLAQLLEQLTPLAPAKLVSDLSLLQKEVEARSLTIREWRNRRIAHSDLSTAMHVSEAVLPGISRQDIEAVLSPMRRFMNQISGAYSDSETGYEDFMSVTGGDRLLRLLHKADEAIRAERDAEERELRNLGKHKSA